MKKRGWIRIVEAFIAILLITGVLLIVINKGYVGKANISEKVYKAELSILREISLDNALRQDILEETTIPTENIPINVQNKIDNRIPDYLECRAKLCKMDVICVLEEYVEGDVYAQAVGITANNEQYSPRQLKLFCWVK